jgi:hypothetical protein
MKFKYYSDWCVVCNSHHLVIQEITTRQAVDCVLTNLNDRAMDTTVGMVAELGLELGRK